MPSVWRNTSAAPTAAPKGLPRWGCTEERPNKMVVSLLNVERETAGGIAAPVQRTADGGYARLQPPLLLNLNVMLAAVFDERQYHNGITHNIYNV